MHFGKLVCCWCSLTVLAIWTLLRFAEDKPAKAEDSQTQPPNVVLILVDVWTDFGRLLDDGWTKCFTNSGIVAALVKHFFNFVR